MTSGYSPIGAMIASATGSWSRSCTGDTTFAHGFTFGGHPVSAAVALANLDIFEREGLNEHVLRQRGRLPARRSRSCTTCRSSATSAATGTSTASSWSRTRPPGRRFDDDESERLLRGFLSKALFDAGPATAGPTTAATRSSSSRRR